MEMPINVVVVKTQARASVIENAPEGLPRALLAIVTHLLR